MRDSWSALLDIFAQQEQENQRAVQRCVYFFHWLRRLIGFSGFNLKPLIVQLISIFGSKIAYLTKKMFCREVIGIVRNLMS